MAITLCKSCKNHCKWGYLYGCVNYTPIPNDEEVMTKEKHNDGKELEKKWENTPWDTDVYLDDLDEKEPMTNEEWFCGLSTEEKVAALVDLHKKVRRKMRTEIGGENSLFNGDYHRQWLKEKHT